jgi:DNA-binding CsgD family transcriptional regulator
MALPSNALLDKGHDALARGDYTEARRLFDDAADDECGEAFEGLARCVYHDADYQGAIANYEHAYMAYRKCADDRSARRAALTIAYLSAVYDDYAVMAGWVARAQSLLDDSGDEPVDRGWVQLYVALSNSDVGGREKTLRECIAIGRRCGDADLQFDALSLLGQLKVELGQYDEGLRLQDEALAAACAGEVATFFVVEGIFCGMFASCEHAVDIARAEQWLRAGDGVVRSLGLRTTSGICRAHYGALLTAAGRWREAEATLIDSARVFRTVRTRHLGSALARLADLRIRQGRIEEAEQLLEGHHEHPDAQRPLAALHLARGDTELARDRIERSLDAADEAPAAGPLLALLTEVHLASGRSPEAALAAERLCAIAAAQRSHYLDATAALAQGQVGAATGSAEAPGLLRNAISGFSLAHTPLELACAKLALAKALARERRAVSISEARAALESFEQLEASRYVDAAAALLRSLGAPVRGGPRSNNPLTSREGDVLELLGLGLSNPEIAERLYISRKTVGHHVSRILAKLDLRNRAEAAAYAARHSPRAAARPNRPESPTQDGGTM